MESPAPAFSLKKEAERVFNSILIEEDFNFYALYGKAMTLFKDGYLEECMDFIDRAIKVEPADTGSNVKVMRQKIQKMIQSKGSSAVYERLHIAGHKIGQRPADTKDKINMCKICDKTFTKPFSLNRHMYLHTGEKPHKCSICRKPFIQKTDMVRHEMTHSDLLNFQCTMCDKRFKTKKNLTCHQVIHSTDRPYKCRFCEKDFKIKRLWVFHEGLHNDMKPFNCDICGKGFPAKPYMKSHLKTHIDDKPYACPVCNFRFKRNYDLSFHIRNQHKQYSE